MQVQELVKELSAEIGTVSISNVLRILSKKKEGLKASSELDESLVNYVRGKYIKTEDKKPEPNKHLKPATRKPATKQEPRRPRAYRPAPVTGGPIDPSEKLLRPVTKKTTDGKTTRMTAKDGTTTVRKKTVDGETKTVKTTRTVKKPVAETETTQETRLPVTAAEETKTSEVAKKTVNAVENSAVKAEETTGTVEASVAVKESPAAAEVKEEKTTPAGNDAAAETSKTDSAAAEAKAEKAADVSGTDKTPSDHKEEQAESAPAAKEEAKDEARPKKERRVISSPIREQQQPVTILDAKTIAARVAASQSKREAARKDRPARGEGGRPEGRQDNRFEGRRGENRGEGRGPRPDGQRPPRDGQRPPRGEGGRPDNRRTEGREGQDKDRERRGSSDNRFAGRGRTDRPERGGAAVEAPAEKFGKDRRDRHEKNKQDKDKQDRDRFDRKEGRGDRNDRGDRMGMDSRDEVRVKKNQKPQKGQKNQAPAPKAPEEPVIRNITLPETLTLKELADKMKQPVAAMIKKLFLEGKMVTVNTELSFDDASMIALEYNYIAEQEEKIDIVEEAIRDIEDAPESLTPRPPVVCVMGHVDHGKTSLLDAIRNSDITKDEAGGITQHIGAYVVKANGQRITFLDTPGHEAFTAMRLRGAQATDIAILVVAADDGVMPQTVEAINHATAAGIEIIVAINKIDKPSANVDRVKQELMEYGLVAEEWGGSTIFCPVSAHTHEGISNLLDMIILTAEVLELKANADRRARGVVIEARLDRGRGSVATLLVQKGTLHVGDFVAIGEVHGRVRGMLDHKQRNVKEATPSTPVEITGLSGVPNSGDTFISTDTEKEARQISEAFITRGKENLIAETKARMSLDDLFNQMQEGNLKELKLIIKADVQGSVEAVKQSLLKLSNDEIVIKCIHSGVGAINESDVTLASASGAIIIGFNIRPDAQAKQLADEEKVDVRLYKVIYNAIDDIESAMKGMLDPIYEERVTGHAEVRQVYKASGIGSIAGSYVLDGVIERGSSARITRDGEQIFDGKIASLKRFKDDAKEVRSGYECGIVFDGHNDITEGDQIEIYKMVEVPRQ